MKKKTVTAILAGTVLALLAGCGASGGTKEGSSEQAVTAAGSEANPEENNNESNEILVSAAASLTDVLNELAEKYQEEHPETEISFTFGGSGALQTQIEEGAPVDLFFSAAEENMDALEEKGLIDTKTRRDLLKNEIVLITPKDGTDAVTFESLPGNAERIALGEPESVPAGKYAQQIFEQIGNWEAVKEHAVFAGNVREVLTWVENGEAACGVVYATDAATSENIQVICNAPENGPEVRYPAAVVKDCRNPEGAEEFLAYLSGEEAAKSFASWGFTVLE